LRYEIENGIFDRYPGYGRAVIVARGVENADSDPVLLEILREMEDSVRKDLAFESYKEHPRIASWREVFRSMGLNPNKYPPSIANLIKRTYAGKDLPFINRLVTIFNIISLKYVAPCGGDDLAAVTGSIRLGTASGNEVYVPLGQPDKTEHPEEGEIIYYDTGNNDVFCRGWCWKNGDGSKIMPETSDVAINIDAIPPLSLDELEPMAEELASMVTDYCGGTAEIHFLNEENPSFEI